MKLFVAGMSHRTAPLDLREKVAVPAGRIPAAGNRLRVAGDLREVVLVSTCNRVEIYGVTDRPHIEPETLFQLLSPASIEGLGSRLYLLEDGEAVRHLLSVTSGLDSMVLGETDITGQVREAYETSRALGLTGRVLNRLFQKALHVSKEIRSQTSIARGATSIGSLAVGLADSLFGEGLARLTVLVIGAGAMASTCVRHFAKHGVKEIVVCNRSIAHAVELAKEFGGRAAAFENRFAEMLRADVVISATGSPEAIIRRPEMEEVVRARRPRPIFLVDIAVPRDVSPDVAGLPWLHLYDLDRLETVLLGNIRRREEELARCNAIIEQKKAALMDRLSLTEERSHDNRVQSQPGCVLSGPAARSN